MRNISEHKCFVDFNGKFSDEVIERIIKLFFPKNQ